MLKQSTKFYLLVVFLCTAALFSDTRLSNGSSHPECFMLLAGKNATADGNILLAHNNDLSGLEASHIKRYPRKAHHPGAFVLFPSGLKIPQADTTFEWMALKIAKGYAEGDAVAINEYGVAIAGGVALKDDRNSHATEADPLIRTGVTGGIRYIALQRSKTARQCVKMLGNFYTTYGVTYPSGVGISDTGEIWYIESGGGFSWAAVRIPDSCYWPQANGYRIGHINPNDTLNFYCSPGLFEFCKMHNLWNPQDGPFDFSDAFGGGRRERNERPYYDTRRIWRCIDMLNPGLHLSDNLVEYPEYLVPEKKISLAGCFEILRDRYEGTPYENQVDDSGREGERAIASWNAVHTDVISLSQGLPAETGAIMWAAPGPPQTAFYVPVFFGAGDMAEAYTFTPSDEDASAFRIFKNLADRAKTDDSLMTKINARQKDFDAAAIRAVDNFHQNDGIEPAAADSLTGEFSLQALNIARKLLRHDCK